MKFSFLLLTWNRCRFLEACLDALLRSIADKKECEVLVLDNGSTDKTREVLDRYRTEHSPVRCILRDKNYGLNAYKDLFAQAKGNYIVTVDDDVLDFPPNVDRIFAEYMEAFPDYGYLALNVVQNEFTNGAKPGSECYIDDIRDGKTLQSGPTGGWCACFRSRDYRKIRWRLWFRRFSMKRPEDGFISSSFRRQLHLKSGIIKDAVCFHAAGPHYAREFGHLEREIEKYAKAGLQTFVDDYKKYV